MTYRIRDINTIHNNPLNSSISKQQYTIPKAHRFHNNKTEASYKYYDLPSTITKKTTIFSNSQRKTIFQTSKNLPSPDRYNIKVPHDETHPITFGRGRAQCKVLNFLKTTDNPGPGAYNPNPQFVDPHLGTKYSIRARTEQSQKLLSAIPGPGRYEIKTSWLQKQKILSTDKKIGCPLIRPSKSRREIINQQASANVPLCKDRIQVDNPTKTVKGQQTFNKTGGFSIGKSIRFSNRLKTQIPGPGSYDRFSQFI